MCVFLLILQITQSWLWYVHPLDTVRWWTISRCRWKEWESFQSHNKPWTFLSSTKAETFGPWRFAACRNSYFGPSKFETHPRTSAKYHGQSRPPQGHNLSSIANKLRKQSKANNLTEVVKQLQRRGGCVVEVLATEDNIFRGLFYQDKHMQQVFKSYPDMLFCDATYQLLDLRLAVYW